MTSICPTNISVVSCGFPGSIGNATISGNNYNYGNIFTYMCHADFELTSGNLNRTCGEDGNWTGNPPVCSGTSVFNRWQHYNLNIFDSKTFTHDLHNILISFLNLGTNTVLYLFSLSLLACLVTLKESISSVMDMDVIMCIESIP